MSLRSTPGQKGKQAAKKSLSEFTEGQVVDAIVKKVNRYLVLSRKADKKVEAYGMFLRIEDADVSGLCHKSEISDKKSKNVFKALQGFREGDRVKAVITGVDKEKGRVNFSIKPSLFGEVEAEGSDDEEEAAVEADVARDLRSFEMGL